MQGKGLCEMPMCRDEVSPVICHDTQAHASRNRDPRVTIALSQSAQFLADRLRRIEVGSRFGNDAQRV